MNWRRTSSTTDPAARPTASIAMAPNRYGTRPPIKPMITMWLERSKLKLFPPPRGHACSRRRARARQPGRTDGVALGHRLGGVAHRVQRIGDVAHRVRQVGHLRDTAGVVGDRPVRVERDDDARIDSIEVAAIAMP